MEGRVVLVLLKTKVEQTDDTIYVRTTGCLVLAFRLVVASLLINAAWTGNSLPWYTLIAAAILVLGISFKFDKVKK